MNPIDRKIKVTRAPKRGHYDKETIYEILDKNFLCHVGFIHEDYPVVIPTLFGRRDDILYLHGSTASRMIKDLQNGLPLSLTVTQVDGLVLAISAFHHSMNYQSVVVFGEAKIVDDPAEKATALKIISDHLIPGRWEEARQPNSKELKGTTVLKIPLDTASAKVRKGGPIDEEADLQLDIWSGELPIKQICEDPLPAAHQTDNMLLPESVKQYLAKHGLR